MATLMSLLVKLGLDTSSYDSGLGKASGKAESFASTMLKVGKAVLGAAAVGYAFKKTADFIGDTISMASDLAETTSKVGIVFGGNAQSVIDFGKQAALSLGMSEQAALSAAGTYGNLFRSMGMAESVSADMSTGLVQLAGDLASFNNMNPTDVLDKLRAGLSGETEPLRSLGVNLNQAAIEAKAFEMGLIKNKDELTAAAKAQATYALIMEQTTLAQGDFARTSDGLANQQRILAAQFENTKSTIGTAFLPVAQMAMSILNDLFSNPAVQAGIKNIVLGITAMAEKLLSMGNAVKASFGGEAAEVFTNFQGYLQQALDFFNGIWASLVAAVDTFAPQIVANVQTFLDQVKLFWDNNGASILAAVSFVWNMLVTVVGGALSLIVGVVTAVMQYINGYIAMAQAVLSGNWSLAWDIMQQTAATIWETIKTTILNILNGIASMMGTSLAEIGSIWTANWELLKTIVSTVIGNILSYLAGTWGSFRDMGLKMLDGLVSGVAAATQRLIDVVVGAIRKAIEAAKKALKIESPSKVFADIGKNTMLGMAEGIKDTAIEPVMEVRAFTKNLIGEGMAGTQDNRKFEFNYNGNATPQQIFQSYEMALLIG
jgi:phage-related protein